MEEAFDELPEKYRTPEITKELEVRKDYFANEAETIAIPRFTDRILPP